MAVRNLNRELLLWVNPADVLAKTSGGANLCLISVPFDIRRSGTASFVGRLLIGLIDQIDRKRLLRYVKFLREHDSDLDDHTVHNIFETLNAFPSCS
jgi:hypothetical protein